MKSATADKLQINKISPKHLLLQRLNIKHTLEDYKLIIQELTDSFEENDNISEENFTSLKSNDNFTKEESDCIKLLKQAHSEFNYLQQVNCYVKLGDIYLERKDYIKAVTLYNFALSIAEDEKRNYNINISFKDNIKANLRKVEDTFLKSIGAKTNLYDIEKRDGHKSELKKIRGAARDKLEQGTEDEILIFQQISRNLKDFVAKLINECADNLKKIICRHAIIALGSIAREEATPYSDLEWAVLIHPEDYTQENIEYFRNLTWYLFLKIANLGETTANAANIESLTCWLQEDENPVLPGFTFDAQTLVACKTPLGNIHLTTNEELRFELIKTPHDMAKYHNEQSYKKDRHLSTVLKSYSWITGNDVTLLDAYEEEMRIIFESPYNEEIASLRKKRALDMLQETTGRFDNKIGREDKEGRTLNIKYDLQRLPSLLIDHLADYFYISKNGTPTSRLNIWEKIEELFKLDFSRNNQDGMQKLFEAVIKILRLRLECHLTKQFRNDFIYPVSRLEEEIDSKVSFKYSIVEYSKLFNIYYTLIPFHDYMQQSIIIKNIGHCLSSCDFYQNGLDIQAAIYFELLENTKALELYELLLQQYQERQDTNRISYAELMIRLAHLYDLNHNYEKSIEHGHKSISVIENIINQLVKINQINLANYTKVLLARAYNAQGGRYKDKDHQLSMKFYEQAIYKYREIPGMQNDPEYLGTLHNLINESNELTSELKITNLKMIINGFEEYYGTRNTNTALAYESLGAEFIYAYEHYKTEEYKNEALRYLNRALSIYMYLTGKNHPNLITVYNKFATLGKVIRNYDMIFINIMKALVVNNHTEGNLLLNSTLLNNLANYYLRVKEYNMAKTLFELSLWFFCSYTENNYQIAENLVCLSVAYKKLNNPRSLICAVESLNLWHILYPNGSEAEVRALIAIEDCLINNESQKLLCFKCICAPIQICMANNYCGWYELLVNLVVTYFNCNSDLKEKFIVNGYLGTNVSFEIFFQRIIEGAQSILNIEANIDDIITEGRKYSRVLEIPRNNSLDDIAEKQITTQDSGRNL